MQTQIKQNNSSFKKLLRGWLVILVSYILIRIVFLMFGFNSTIALGGCLAIIPYILGARYFRKSCGFKCTWFYTFGILLPAVVEKIVLYLLGAYLYNISSVKITSVLEAIASHKPYVNLFTHPSAQYYVNISFFNWRYVLISVAVSVLLILLLQSKRRRKTQG